MRDLSHTGHELGRAHVSGLPAEASLGAILDARVRSDVARYNEAPGPVFEGLVQPADSVRYSDGHRMQNPRLLDADHLVAAAREAAAAGILWFIVHDRTVTDLGDSVDVDGCEEIAAVLRRPIVAWTA